MAPVPRGPLRRQPQLRRGPRTSWCGPGLDAAAAVARLRCNSLSALWGRPHHGALAACSRIRAALQTQRLPLLLPHPRRGAGRPQAPPLRCQGGRRWDRMKRRPSQAPPSSLQILQWAGPEGRAPAEAPPSKREPWWAGSQGGESSRGPALCPAWLVADQLEGGGSSAPSAAEFRAPTHQAVV